MTPEFLVGAIIGSGLFIFAGREPARRALALLHNRVARRRR